jgi:hypothetical protein
MRESDLVYVNLVKDGDLDVRFSRDYKEKVMSRRVQSLSSRNGFSSRRVDEVIIILVAAH